MVVVVVVGSGDTERLEDECDELSVSQSLSVEPSSSMIVFACGAHQERRAAEQVKVLLSYTQQHNDHHIIQLYTTGSLSHSTSPRTLQLVVYNTTTLSPPPPPHPPTHNVCIAKVHY